VPYTMGSGRGDGASHRKPPEKDSRTLPEGETPPPEPADYRHCGWRSGRDDAAPPARAGIAPEEQRNTPQAGSLPRQHGRPREAAPPANHTVAILHPATTAGLGGNATEQHLKRRETTEASAY
jgi:hypothetical protein